MERRTSGEQVIHEHGFAVHRFLAHYNKGSFEIIPSLFRGESALIFDLSIKFQGALYRK